MNNVLIADDDEMVLGVTVSLMDYIRIGEKPLAVLTAESVQEVTERLQFSPEGFDLIIVDDTLVGGGALEVIKRARAGGRLAPVIVMGGSDLGGMHDKYVGISDVHVLQKPLSLTGLTTLVNGLLGGGRGVGPSAAKRAHSL